MQRKIYSNKICIATNYNCNLKCIYCFQKNKQSFEFNPDEAISVLENFLSKKTENGTKIKFHGGEPFLVFDKIKSVCERLWKLNLPEYYHIHITTNGTLIHGEIQKWLSRNKENITLKLSIDGNRSSHNINRPNSFDLIDIPFFLKTWPGISVNMTITPQTLPFLAENVIFLHESGFKDIISHFALFRDWKNSNLYKTLYDQLNILTDFYLKNPKIAPCHLYRMDISRTLDNYISGNACSLNLSPSYDFQSKKYYPCHMCFPSMAGEKISSELLKVDFSKMSFDKEEINCQKCPFINICVTCYADNYIVRGDIAKRDINVCEYNKIIFASVFKYELNRILKLRNPSSHDIKKMLAIKKWKNEIEKIINSINPQYKYNIGQKV